VGLKWEQGAEPPEPLLTLTTDTITIPGVLWYIIHSRQLYVEKLLFDAGYEGKYTINDRKLVHFTFGHAIKADTKRKLSENK